MPTTTLSLDAPEGTFHRVVCNTVRGGAGILRGAWGGWKDASGFSTHRPSQYPVERLKELPEQSLLRRHLQGQRIHHDDTFRLSLNNPALKGARASQLLARVLEGFLLNAPTGVGRLMAFRNTLVKPLGLRTSPLGCPASSLLSPKTENLFAGQYPVFDQEINADDTRAQVILGANDKHLSFRSCVCVEIKGEGRVDIMLGTRVHCRNLFGRVYMAAIDHVHRRYISPTMLRFAVDYAAGRAAE